MKKSVWVTLGLVAGVALFVFHQHEFAEHRLETPLPLLNTAAADEANRTLTWVGHGEAYRWSEGGWRRTPEQDYQFHVVQRRFDDHWKSIKVMHRRHPDYDGSAGARDQIHYFRVDFSNAGTGTNGAYSVDLESSMGAGEGRSDSSFKTFRFALNKNLDAISAWLVPFNRLEFEQTYDYERGALDEEITLVKAGDSAKTPMFRMIERAKLLAGRHAARPSDAG